MKIRQAFPECGNQAAKKLCREKNYARFAKRLCVSPSIRGRRPARLCNQDESPFLCARKERVAIHPDDFAAADRTKECIKRGYIIAPWPEPGSLVQELMDKHGISREEAEKLVPKLAEDK